MQSSVQELSPILVEIKVEVPWDDVKKDIEEGYARVQKTARLRGFRPGHVPRNVVRQMFGAQVKQEVIAGLVEKGLLDAIQKNNIEAVATPSVEPSPLTDGQPLSFVAKVEVRPKIESLALDDLLVEKVSTEVADQDVSQEVERIRREHSTIATPEPARASKSGDVLTVDYTVAIDGEDKPAMAATDRTMELGEGRLLDDLEKGLTGVSVGDDKTIDVKLADDHASEELRGKTATFKVKIKELKERILPEVDDELAKDAGDYKTLLELRLDLRKKLEAQAKSRADGAIRDRIVDALVAKNAIPVPPSLIDREARNMLRELMQIFQATGQMPGLDDEMLSRIKERAERKLRAAFLFSEIARREKMEVKPDDVDARLAQIAERTGKHLAKVKVDWAGDRRDELASQILEEKILDYLKAKVRIVDALPKEEPKAEAAATAPAEVAEGEKKPKKKKAKAEKPAKDKDEEKA